MSLCFANLFKFCLGSWANDGIDWVEICSDTAIANLVPEGMSSPSSDPDFRWKLPSEEIDKFKASSSARTSGELESFGLISAPKHISNH